MKYSRPFIFGLILTLLLSSACFRERKHVPIDKSRLKGEGTVYLVPLGEFPDDVLEDLVAFYRDKYQLNVQALDHVPLPEGAINSRRKQLIAEEAIEVIKQANPELQKDPKAILIGLTSEDMYINKMNWQFSFSWREGGKYAVVAGGRLGVRNGRRPVTEPLIMKRMRKMVTKNIGLLYYRLPLSDNPRSVLYRDVGGIQELDYMGEEF